MGKKKPFKSANAVTIQISGWKTAPSFGYEGTGDECCADGKCNTPVVKRHDPDAHLVHKVAGYQIVKSSPADMALETGVSSEIIAKHKHDDYADAPKPRILY